MGGSCGRVTTPKEAWSPSRENCVIQFSVFSLLPFSFSPVSFFLVPFLGLVQSPLLTLMATGGGSDNNDRPRLWRKREHDHLLEDGASERSLRPRSTKAPRRRTSEPSVYVYKCVL